MSPEETTAPATAETVTFKPEDNRAYGIKVCRKQKQLDEVAATAAFDALTPLAQAELVEVGRAGNLPRVRELLA